MPIKMNTTSQTPLVSSTNRAGEAESDSRSHQEGSDWTHAFTHIILGND